jgi:hypothetical protein
MGVAELVEVCRGIGSAWEAPQRGDELGLEPSQGKMQSRSCTIYRASCTNSYLMWSRTQFISK